MPDALEDTSLRMVDKNENQDQRRLTRANFVSLGRRRSACSSLAAKIPPGSGGSNLARWNYDDSIDLLVFGARTARSDNAADESREMQRDR